MKLALALLALFAFAAPVSALSDTVTTSSGCTGSPGACESLQKEYDGQIAALAEHKADNDAAFKRVLASASPALAEYIKEMKAAAENAGHSNAAVKCNLRSARWAQVFADGFYLIDRDEGSRLGITVKDRQPLQGMISQAGEIAEYVIYNGPNATCPRMLNSPLMTNLDRIHDRMTGGYR